MSLWVQSKWFKGRGRGNSGRQDSDRTVQESVKQLVSSGLRLVPLAGKTAHLG